MSDNDTSDELASYLANHPRMLGVLFTIALLLTQTGNAAAANGTTFSP